MWAKIEHSAPLEIGVMSSRLHLLNALQLRVRKYRLDVLTNANKANIKFVVVACHTVLIDAYRVLGSAHLVRDFHLPAMTSPASTALSSQVASLEIQDPQPPSAGADDALAAPAPQIATTTPAVNALRALLRQTLRVTIGDGRVFLGTFAGTDKLLNVLLVNADEFVARAYANPDGRFVGLVQIPWRLVVKVEVHRPQGLRARGASSGFAYERMPEDGEDEEDEEDDAYYS